MEINKTIGQMVFESNINRIMENSKKTLAQLLKENRKKFNISDARYVEIMEEIDTEIWASMLRELIALRLWNRDTQYDKAKILLYTGLLEDNLTHIKKAGEMLYESEGMSGLNDYLLWSFIPKDLHRYIDIAWDGIGEWQG